MPDHYTRDELVYVDEVLRRLAEREAQQQHAEGEGAA